MNQTVFNAAMVVIAIAFTAFFTVTIVPLMFTQADVMTAIMGGFVNPYAAGYSTDVILCWVVLACWVIYEAKTYRIKHGWICLLLGAVPGVAVGLPLYLLLRQRQLTQMTRESSTVS